MEETHLINGNHRRERSSHIAVPTSSARRPLKRPDHETRSDEVRYLMRLRTASTMPAASAVSIS